MYLRIIQKHACTMYLGNDGLQIICNGTKFFRRMPHEHIADNPNVKSVLRAFSFLFWVCVCAGGGGVNRMQFTIITNSMH